MTVEVIESSREQWPVCFFCLDGEPSVEAFEGYLATFDEMYARRQPFSIITHIKRYRPKPELISRTGRWVKETHRMIERYWVSNAIYCESPGFRFVLSTVNLIKPIPAPQRVCASREEAMEFTRGLWRARGTELPPLRWPFQQEQRVSGDGGG